MFLPAPAPSTLSQAVGCAQAALDKKVYYNRDQMVSPDRLRPGVTILQVILYHTQPGGTLISKAALVRLTPLTLNFSPNSRLKETQCRTGRSTST